MSVLLLTLPPNLFPLKEWEGGLVRWSKPHECVEKREFELLHKIRAGRAMRQLLLEINVITSDRLMGGEPGKLVAGEHRMSRNDGRIYLFISEIQPVPDRSLD